MNDNNNGCLGLAVGLIVVAIGVFALLVAC